MRYFPIQKPCLTKVLRRYPKGQLVYSVQILMNQTLSLVWLEIVIICAKRLFQPCTKNNEAHAKGQPVGGIGAAGRECLGFVPALNIIATSFADPSYNRNTQLVLNKKVAPGLVPPDNTSRWKK